LQSGASQRSCKGGFNPRDHPYRSHDGKQNISSGSDLQAEVSAMRRVGFLNLAHEKDWNGEKVPSYLACFVPRLLFFRPLLAPTMSYQGANGSFIISRHEGPEATKRFIEFFTTNIRSPEHQASYARGRKPPGQRLATRSLNV